MATLWCSDRIYNLKTNRQGSEAYFKTHSIIRVLRTTDDIKFRATDPDPAETKTSEPKSFILFQYMTP